MKFHLPTIRHDQEGFSFLVSLHSQTRECLYENISIDMGSTRWFDADMYAAFGRPFNSGATPWLRIYENRRYWTFSTVSGFTF